MKTLSVVLIAGLACLSCASEGELTALEQDNVGVTQQAIDGCTLGDIIPVQNGSIGIFVCEGGAVCENTCKLDAQVGVIFCQFYCPKPECVIDLDKRINAGWPGIAEATCKQRGACWDSRTTDPKHPWCYEPSTATMTCDPSSPTTRVAQGWPGISAQTCVNDLGACWDNRTRNVPWCYAKRPR